jgi:thiol-disulfide isomerase/thioredoxin
MPARRQGGQASRRALLVLGGLGGVAAAAGGFYLSLRHFDAGPTSPNPPDSPASALDAAKSASQTGASASQAVSAALLEGDTLTAAFWQQVFDTPGGPPLNLSALQGKPLLINFWATWCPPCVKEMPELDQFAREFAPLGWQVLGLAIDGPTPVKAFLAKVRVGFAIGLAGFEGTELSQALGNTAGGLPFTVLIDAQGRIRHRKMGATSHQELARWAKGMKPA